jgi:hypothetical protein
MTSTQQLPTDRKKTFGFVILALVGIGILFLGSMLPKWIIPEQKPEQEASIDKPEVTPLKGSSTKVAQLKENSPQLSSIFFRILIGFGIVLGICLAITKYSNRTLTAATNQPGRLRLLASAPINNRCCLYVIQVDSQRVLASVDITGLKSLTYLPSNGSGQATPKTEEERSDLLDNLLLATRIKLESSPDLPSRLIG